MTTAISITDLKKTYANGFEALKGISLEVQQGDFFALLGPNGAGKSTTIGVISTLAVFYIHLMLLCTTSGLC